MKRQRLCKVIVNTLLMSLALMGLLSVASADDKILVGISMPTKSSARWIADGDNIVKLFNESGYETDLQYAEDEIPNQLAQIENMITQKVNVLVIAPIDGATLSEVLQKAADSNIKVIAYDRLIRGSPHVDYYVTFDNFQVGVLQGQYIESRLQLKTAPGPFNLELFAGAPDDNNSYFFYAGAMSVLQPYIDQGKLVVRSKQTCPLKEGQACLNIIATPHWDAALAQARMENILSKSYAKAHLDAVLSADDMLSMGILASLKSAGYGTPNNPLPIVTGQDAEIPSVTSIINCEQTQTVFKDTRVLSKQVLQMVKALYPLSPSAPKTEVEVNDTKTYDNGIKVVPTYLLKPVSVDASNWKRELIDSGYYAKDQFPQESHSCPMQKTS